MSTTDHVSDPRQLPQVEGRNWTRACGVDAVAEDEGLVVGTLPPVSVFATPDGFFCIDDTCTHETYSLAEGWVENCVVECTLHLAKFDLRTGAPVGPPAVRPVAVHPVAVVGTHLYIALPANYLVKENINGTAG